MIPRGIAMTAAAVLSCTVAASEDVSLDGEWLFAVSNETLRSVTVPHTWNVDEGLEDYLGRATYTKAIGDVSALQGKTIRLHFEAVYHSAIVSLNGKIIGEHKGAGFTPFSFDITTALDYSKGAKNTLVVEVDNSLSELNFPWMAKFDWANDGGIYRSVRLHISGSPSIRCVHLTPDVTTGKVDVEIKTWEGETRHDSFTVENPILWHFDNPHLYTYTADIGTDKMTCTYGFRSLEIDGESLVFNGEKVRLPGLEAMPGSNPAYGMAEPKEYQERQVAMLKRANAVLTRFHWPQSEAMLDACDRAGILVAAELPWWQGPEKLTPEQLELAKLTLDEIIEYSYNHPSVVIWGISNEVQRNGEELKILGEHVKSRDKQGRIVWSVANRTHMNKAKEPTYVLDLPTFNEYIGTWYERGNREKLPTLLRAINEAAPGRPLAITEFGLCEPRFPGGDLKRADELIYHLKCWQSEPFVCAYIYFCLNDYRTYAGEEGRGKYRIRRHGLADLELNPKASYELLRLAASPVEITAVGRKGNAAAVTIRGRGAIPSYTLRGYSVRYSDAFGGERTIPLPDLAPGAEHSLVLEDINPSFHFSINRKDGSCVSEY